MCGDELVVRDPGPDGPIRRIHLAQGMQPTLVPQPERKAWIPPKGYKPENPDGIAAEDYVGEVELTVVGAEIWKGRCVDAVPHEGARCSEYHYLGLDPPGAEVKLVLPSARPPIPVSLQPPRATRSSS